MVESSQISPNKTAPLDINKVDIKFEGPTSEKFNLSFIGKNLEDVEHFGQIDPFIIVQMLDVETGTWVEQGRT